MSDTRLRTLVRRPRGLAAGWLVRVAATMTLALFLAAAVGGCNQNSATSDAENNNEGGGTPQPHAAAPATLTPPARVGTTLFLAQAQFVDKTDATGKKTSVPGPARLVIYRKGERRWSRNVIEDPDSNVFHKAQWFQPAEGDAGILTIGAQKAFLKLWRKHDQEWVADALWNPTFGGQWDRLRDFEVGDVTRNGTNDIVIATHDQGVVAIVSWSPEKKAYTATEIDRSPGVFVHEIELGDADGDGHLEIFDTPSHPNKLDGSVQPGAIDLWRLENGKWVRHRIADLKTRHAKEILAITLPGEHQSVLLASLEGERIGGKTGTGDTTRIRMYRFQGGTFASSDVASLPGKLCRFLTWGDTDGDGKKEVIAFTKSDGIWKLTPPATPDSAWQKQRIATNTSGFEHAAYLFDANGDGRDEIFVASDDQKELRCYWFDGTQYTYEVLDRLKDRTISWNITAVQLQ